jgi:hypothetical protein
MNEQHTPGPWAVNWAGSGRDGKLVYDEVYVYAPECGVEDIAVAADIADPLTGKPSEANARLISASPEMLEALRIADAFCGSLTSDVCPDGVHIPIRAAIAKATLEAA